MLSLRSIFFLNWYIPKLFYEKKKLRKVVDEKMKSVSYIRFILFSKQIYNFHASHYAFCDAKTSIYIKSVTKYSIE